MKRTFKIVASIALLSFVAANKASEAQNEQPNQRKEINRSNFHTELTGILALQKANIKLAIKDALEKKARMREENKEIRKENNPNWNPQAVNPNITFVATPLVTYDKRKNENFLVVHI